MHSARPHDRCSRKRHHHSARLGQAALLLLTALMASTASARLPSDAPPLPDPASQGYTVVNVSTAQQLVDVAWTLADGQAIVLAPGTYDLSTVVPPSGQNAVVLGPTSGPPLNEVQIRGQTGDPADVQIVGAGMINPGALFGIRLRGVTNIVIADLTISQVYYHCVFLDGFFLPANILLYHCRFLDSGQHLVKVSSSGGEPTTDLVLEYCTLGYSAGATAHPDLGYTHAGGVLASSAVDMVVRDCLFQGIWNQDDSLGGHGVLAWNGSTGTLVERCTFLDCARGVALGYSGDDHTGGIVRNNLVRWDSGASYLLDTAITTSSPGSMILHNTILMNGGYFAGIEIRFGTTTGVEVRQNLLDAIVWERDGASALVVDNITTAAPSWFVDPATGDLHLDPAGGAAAIDQVSLLPDAPDDFDAQARSASPGMVDIGGDEVWAATGVPSLPVEFRLMAAVPNPFNPRTIIRYELPEARTVFLRVYDLTGRLVRTLVDDELVPAGRHEAVWNGKDANGRDCPSGVYFSRLEAGDQAAHNRMMLVR